MPNNYAAGRRAEYAVRDWLLDNGALFVARTAGSKSPADLIAIFRRRHKFTDRGNRCSDSAAGATFVQVKRTKPTKATAKAIKELAASTGTRWLLVHYDRGIKSMEELS